MVRMAVTVAVLGALIGAAQPPAAPADYLTTGGLFVGLSGSLLVFWRFQRNALETQRRELRRLARSDRVKEWRIGVLRTALETNGVAIPASFWGAPPDQDDDP